MIGKALGRYRIVEKIGEGGMGVVYRARDERLERDVALKILSSGKLADQDSRNRFRREALALARLSHSNIGAVHDFDTQEDVDFLVMEYIPGMTLSDKLASGPLPEQEILRHGQQLAEGLLAAHEKGVVHRDLKPGNLRITPDGQLKILDFGLAKLLQPPAETDLTQTFTQTGQLAGTLPYMAPEQLRGEPVDTRTDIYALGTVLYEMATGDRPFAEKTAPRLTDDILHKPPPPPSQQNPDLSSGLEQVVLKCLEKAPDDRYQSAKDVLTDLGRVSTGETTLAARHDRLREAPPAGRVMLAVLPFENLSGDPDQEYFSDGLTWDMITELGSLGSKRLGVIARTSAMQYKNTDKGIGQIGRELRADYVLEGSVRRAGQRLRITAQLIVVRDQTQLWAQRYDRDHRDILALQSEVAQAIAAGIQIAIAPDDQARLARARPVNPEAHEACLKGRWYFDKYSMQGFPKARQYFELAIEKDPNYAPAYAWLANSYGGAGLWGYMRPREAAAKGREAALKAVELDDTLAEAHLALAGWSFGYDWDWPAAEREFKRAIELNPNLPEVRHSYSFYSTTMGRLDEAIAESKRAEELDPLNLGGMAVVGANLRVAHRYDEAIEQLQKPLEMDPNFYPARQELWRAYRHKNLYAEAFREAKKAFSLLEDQEVVEAMQRGYEESGYPGAMRLAATKLAARSKQRYVLPYEIARLYSDTEDKDQTLHWLQRAYDERDARLVYLREPDWDGLRSDPLFQDLLGRMDYPP